MQVFSGLYKKMCGKAEELQDIWEPEEWDECCKKGDHEEDGIVKEYHPGILSDEEKKSFKANYTWLPKGNDVERRVWKTWGLDSIRRLKEKEYDEFLEDKERMKCQYKRDSKQHIVGSITSKANR